MKTASRKRHAGSNPVRGVDSYQKKVAGLTPCDFLVDLNGECIDFVDVYAEQSLSPVKVFDKSEW